MQHQMTTMRDLRNWVDGQITDPVQPGVIDAIAAQIQSMDHPQWGTDWAGFLESLPDLVEIIDDSY